MPKPTDLASIDRQNFLQNYWSRYPSCPTGKDWVWGRLTALDPYQVSTQTHSYVRECKTWLAEAELAPTPRQVLQIGDWIAVNAQHQCLLLAPALNALPLGINPSVDTLKKWNQYLHITRAYFSDQGFMEVPTPTLVPSPGTEPWVEAFSCEFRWGSQRHTYFLPFSPEFHLKKMLGLGYEKVFEIARCFRNGDVGLWHEPEFFMLEWYECFVAFEQLRGRLIDWLRQVSKEMRVPLPHVKTVRLQELLAAKFGFQMSADPSVAELRQFLRKIDEGYSEDEGWMDLFSRLMLRLEQSVATEGLFLIQGFPRPLAQLARVGADGWAERFELLWDGLEIANGFHELNDPLEQQQRFIKDAEQRLIRGGESVPHDLEFLRIMQSGMPPAVGIAVGLERLFARLNGLSRLDQVRPFSIARHVTP